MSVASSYITKRRFLKQKLSLTAPWGTVNYYYHERMAIGQCVPTTSNRNFPFISVILQLTIMNLEYNAHVFLFFAFSAQIVCPLIETIAATHSPMAILSCHLESKVCQLVDKLNFCFKIY